MLGFFIEKCIESWCQSFVIFTYLKKVKISANIRGQTYPNNPTHPDIQLAEIFFHQNNVQNYYLQILDTDTLNFKHLNFKCRKISFFTG